jgi:hypothetical protein
MRDLELIRAQSPTASARPTETIGMLRDNANKFDPEKGLNINDVYRDRTEQ